MTIREQKRLQVLNELEAGRISNAEASELRAVRGVVDLAGRSPLDVEGGQRSDNHSAAGGHGQTFLGTPGNHARTGAGRPV